MTCCCPAHGQQTPTASPNDQINRGNHKHVFRQNILNNINGFKGMSKKNKFYWMFENDILRNYSKIYLVSWGGFWAFGHPNDARTPRWLDYAMVLASRVSGCLFGHQNPQKPSLRTPKKLQRNFLKCQSEAYNWIFSIFIWFPWHCIRISFLILIKFIHVYGWNLSILWSPFKIWTPKNFTIANFGHPVSKYWLRPWTMLWILALFNNFFFYCNWWIIGTCDY